MKTQGFSFPDVAIVSEPFQEKGQTNVIKWDVYPIAEECLLRLVFQDWKNTARHSVWLAVEGDLVVNGYASPNLDIWTDTAPQEVIIQVRSSTGRLHVYKIWDSDEYGRQSQSYSSGMLVEQLANGRRYRCSDIGFETEFDDLVFRIEIV